MNLGASHVVEPLRGKNREVDQGTLEQGRHTGICVGSRQLAKPQASAPQFDLQQFTEPGDITGCEEIDMHAVGRRQPFIGRCLRTDRGAGRVGPQVPHVPEHGPQGRHMLDQVRSAGHLHLCGRVWVIIEHDEAAGLADS